MEGEECVELGMLLARKPARFGRKLNIAVKTIGAFIHADEL